MADAVLYYRNGYDDAPDQKTIAQLSAGQKVIFTFPDNTLETLQFSYVNNVVDIPVPVSDGTRKINKQENGLRSIQLVINGRIKKPSAQNSLTTNVTNLINMSKRQQVDAVYPYGNVGIYAPSSPEFSLDPNASASPDVPATKGYTITSWDLGYTNPKVRSYDFRVVLSFGGTW